MKKFMKWLGLVVLALVALLVILLAYVYSASEKEFARTYTATETLSIPLPTDLGEIAEGQRLAELTGCTHCHGDDLTGAVPVDIPGVARFVAPNITSIVPDYSDAQMVGLLRRGVRLDGRGVWLMPSQMFRHLHDEDLARIIAWVRTVPKAAGITGQTRIHLMGRAIVVAGKFKSGAREIDEIIAKGESKAPVGRGEYLVMSLCSECHGQDLNGREDAHSPPLAVAKGYSLEQFAKLMHDGVGIGGREFELMTPTSKVRFSHLAPDEVQAIHSFLLSR